MSTIENVKAQAQDKYARAKALATSEAVVSAAKTTGVVLGGATVLGVGYALFATAANKVFAAMN